MYPGRRPNEIDLACNLDVSRGEGIVATAQGGSLREENGMSRMNGAFTLESIKAIVLGETSREKNWTNRDGEFKVEKSKAQYRLQMRDLPAK